MFAEVDQRIMEKHELGWDRALRAQKESNE
jgi:hypothetical protein